MQRAVVVFSFQNESELGGYTFKCCLTQINTLTHNQTRVSIGTVKKTKFTFFIQASKI